MARTYNSEPMSQITRCPACGTTFKVVADQLRISDGWVRCGQCKEVFDAAAHLVRAASHDLLPEMAIPDGPRPAARPPAVAERAWGGGIAATPLSPSTSSPPQAPPAFAQPTAPEPSAARDLHVAMDDTLPAPLEVPEPPAVPSFLTARPLASPTMEPPADWSLEPASPLGWRVRPAASDAARDAAKPVSVAPGPVQGWELPGSAPDDEPALDGLAETPVADARDDEQAAPAAVPPAQELSGYELPFAELRDSEWPDHLDDDEPTSVHTDEPPQGKPHGSLRQEATDDAIAKAVAMDMALEAIDADTDPVAIATQAGGGMEGLAPTVTGPGTASADARHVSRRPHVPSDADDDDDEETAASPTQDEPDFVRAARRKAFWRKPVVRISMAMLLMVLLAGLGLQMAVQERERLASQYPGVRPVLQALCVPLQCTIGAPRRIADVVIDSSSFNKARGDSYQLALSIKSRAGFALAMPSVELTLTDAQDRPVLRRVLRPQELGAPGEIAPGGEWSGTLPVVVVTGGARVSGYRVLAFYP